MSYIAYTFKGATSGGTDNKSFYDDQGLGVQLNPGSLGGGSTTLSNIWYQKGTSCLVFYGKPQSQDFASFMQAQPSPYLDLGNGDFTVEVSFRPTALNGYGANTLVSLSDGSNFNLPSLQIGLDINGLPFASGGAVSSGTSTNDFSIKGTSAVSLNHGHILSLVRSAGVLTLYLDGAVVATGSNSSTLNSNLKLTVGAGFTTHLFDAFTGDIDQVIVNKAAMHSGAYTVTLSDGQGSTTSGGGSSISVSASTSAVDPYSTGVKVLTTLNEAANGATIFTDLYGNTLTCENGVAVTTSTTHFGLPTIALTGAGNGRITLAPTNAFDLSVAAASTVETWLYPTAITGGIIGGGACPIFSNGTSSGSMNGFFVCSNSSGQVGLYLREYWCIPLGTAGVINFNAWNHIAVCFQGNTAYLLVNGTLQGTGTVSDISRLGGTDCATVIGSVYSDATPAGFLGQFRITKGVARYTTNYTVPTAAWGVVTSSSDEYASSVTMDFLPEGFAGEKTWTDRYGNTFALDTDTNFDSIIKLSGLPTVSLVHASGMSISPASALDLTGEKSTLEFWMRPTGNGGNCFSTGDNTGPMSGFFLGVNPSGQLFLYVREYYLIAPTTATVTYGQWNHVAMVTDGLTVTLYLNGTAVGTGTYGSAGAKAQGFGVSNKAYINTSVYADGGITGSYGQIRVTKGVARYTAAFTPKQWLDVPVVTDDYAPKVSLLLDGTSFADRSPRALALTVVKPQGSGVSISSAASEFNTTSIAFGNLHGRINVAYNDTLNLSSGDFTIEADVYLQALNGVILSKDQHYGSTYTSYFLGVGPDGLVHATVGRGTDNTWALDLFSNTALTVNVWNTLALVRSGNQLLLFINGKLDNSAEITGTMTDSGADLWIGDMDVGATNASLNGYIQQLRITKGVARYTTNYRTTGLVNGRAASLNAGDPNWDKVSLYVDFEGSADATSIADKSVYANAIVSVTDSTTTNAPTVFSGGYGGGNSLNIDGSYLKIDSNAGLVLANATSWTAEATIRLTAYPPEDLGTIFAKDDLWGIHETSYHLAIQSDGKIQATIGDPTGSGVHNTLVTTQPVPLNQWVHVAMVRDGTNFAVFLNGVGTYQTGVSLVMQDVGLPLLVGSLFKGTGSGLNAQRYHGDLDNLRITKGIARYTSDFVVGSYTTALLLRAGDSESSGTLVDTGNYALSDYRMRGVSVSPAQSLTGSGEAFYFAGTANNAIVFQNSTAFGLGAGDFTIESWVYVPTYQSTGALFDFRTDGSYDRAGFFLDGGQKVPWILINGNRYGDTDGSTIQVPVNAWTHIAFVRNNGTVTCYINGAVSWTTNQAIDFTTTSQLGIGSCANPAFGNNPFNGYMDQIRVVKGKAMYTSAFTPSTLPLTSYTPPISGVADTYASKVVLLLHGRGNQGSTDFVDDGSLGLIRTTVAGIGIDETRALYGFSSINATGVGSVIGYPELAAFGLGTGDFTLEGWIYPTALDGDRNLFDFRQADGSDKAVFFLHNAQLSVWGAGGVAAGNVGASVVLNAWQHVAFSRSNGVITAWLNGQQVWSTTTVYDIGSSAPLGVSGGIFSGGVGSSPFQGNFCEMRVTKGVGRYTTTFTPQSTVFQNAHLSNYSFQTAANDKNFSNVVLWLQDGVVDSSNSAHTPLNADTGPYLSTRRALFGNNALHFAGDIPLQFAPSADFNMSSNDFTAEAWVFPLGTNAYGIFAARNSSTTGWALQTNGFRANLNGSWSDAQIPGLPQVPPEQWTHVALEKSGTTISVYYNGVLAGQVTGVTSVNDGDSLVIGAASYSSNENVFVGYMQGVRFTKGVARYSSLTTPLIPKKAFDSNDFYWNNTTVLLHFDQGSVSNSGNYPTSNTATPDDSQYHHRVWAQFNSPPMNQQPSMFGGSVLLASDYNDRRDLQIGGYQTGPNTSLLVDTDGGQSPSGTEDFTIESFFRPMRYPAGGQVYILYHWWDGSHGINVELREDGTVGIWIAGPGTYSVTSTTLPLNAWTYVALTRQGDSVYLYFNGTMVASAALPAGYALPNVAFFLGGDQTTDNREYYGYVDEFRMTKGVARLSPQSKFLVNPAASEYPDYAAPSVGPTAQLTTTSTGTIRYGDTAHLVFTATGLTDPGSYYVAITANGQSTTQSFTTDAEGNATVQIDVISSSYNATRIDTSIVYTVQAFMGGQAKSPVASYTLALTATPISAAITTASVSPKMSDTVSFSYHIDYLPVSSTAFDLVIYANGQQSHLLSLGGTAGQSLDASFSFKPSDVGAVASTTSMVVTAQLYLANYGFIGPVASYTLGMTATPVVSPSGHLTFGNKALRYTDLPIVYYNGTGFDPMVGTSFTVFANGFTLSGTDNGPQLDGTANGYCQFYIGSWQYGNDANFPHGVTSIAVTGQINFPSLGTTLSLGSASMAIIADVPVASVSVSSSVVVSGNVVYTLTATDLLPEYTNWFSVTLNGVEKHFAITVDQNNFTGTSTATIPLTDVNISAAGSYNATFKIRTGKVNMYQANSPDFVNSVDTGAVIADKTLTVGAGGSNGGTVSAIGSLTLGKTTMAINESVSARLNFTGFIPNRDYILQFYAGSVKGTELGFFVTTDSNGSFSDIGTGYSTYAFSPTDSQISVGNNQPLLMQIRLSDQSAPAVSYDPGITINVTAENYGETGSSSDPYASKVVLLLDLSTDKHSIIDRSPVGWEMNQVPVYSHESQLGGTGTYIWLGPNEKGLKVGGTASDFLTYVQDPQKLSNFDLTGVDWTIESITSYNYWENIASITAKTGGTGLNIGALSNTSANIGVYTHVDGVQVDLAEPVVNVGPPGSVVKQHVAAVCRSGVITIYIGGQVYATGPAQSSPFGVPAFDNFFTAAGCSIDGLRITKGVARYTSPFVPPTGFSGSTMGNANGFSGIISDTLSDAYDPFYDRVTLNVSMLRTAVNSISAVADYGPSAYPVSTIGTVTLETVTVNPNTYRYLRLNGSGAIKFSGLGSGIRFDNDDWTIELTYQWMGGSTSFKLLDLGPSLVVMVQGGVYQVQTQTNPGGVDPDSFTYTDPYFNLSDTKAISISRVGKMLFFHSNGVKVAEKTMVPNNDFPYYTDTLYVGGDAQSVTNGTGGNIRFQQIRVTRGVGRYVGNYTVQFPYSANSYYDIELLDRLTGTAGNPLTGHVADVGGAAWGDTSGFSGIPSQTTNMTFVSNGVHPGKGVR
jgi:hypothetical protein